MEPPFVQVPRGPRQPGLQFPLPTWRRTQTLTLLCFLCLCPWGQVFFPFPSTWWRFWLYVKWKSFPCRPGKMERLKLAFPLTSFCVFLFWAPQRKCSNSVFSFPPVHPWPTTDHRASLLAPPISQARWFYLCGPNTQKSDEGAYLPLQFWGWGPVLGIRETKFGDNFEPLLSVLGLLKAMIPLEKITMQVTHILCKWGAAIEKRARCWGKRSL